MPYDFRYALEALEDLKRLRAHDRALIVGSIQGVLASNPTLTSRSRVKLLRQPAPAQYRLRVGDYRVLYDVVGGVVAILRVLSKEAASAYMEDKT